MKTSHFFVYRTRISNLFSGVALLWVLYACANIVSPAGGPKDTTPPAEISSEPKQESTSYQGKTITIRFNEYIQAPTLQQELLISPPMITKPVIKVQGKSLKIQWDDTLRENTTYTFQFGSAIKDITEGNAANNLRFFFSTGPDIDSLSIEGKVQNAWDGKAEENILVMLYPEHVADSMIPQTLPLYVARTGKDGRYSFSKLSGGSYLLAAVSDQNNNMKYDLITEPFAFYPVAVSPKYHDTSAVTEPGDSLIPQVKPVAADYLLRMFTGTDSIQKILSVVTDGTHKAVVAFRYPVENSGVELPAELQTGNTGYRWNRTSDTLTFWLKQALEDSIKVKISGYRFSDTAHMVFRQAAAGGRGTQKTPKVGITVNVPRGGKFSPVDTPMVLVSQPLTDLNNNKALFITRTDTIPLQLEPHGPYPYLSYRIGNPLQQDSLTKILIPAGTVTGWDGSTNDSVDWAFTLQGFDSYGKLSLTVETDTSPEAQVIIYLMDDKSLILEKRILTHRGAEEVFFPLKPGNYRLKAALDVNHNGRWDTGDFLKRQQPEPVIIMDSPIQVKAAWTEELTWKLTFNQ